MTLIDELSAHRCAFFIEARGSADEIQAAIDELLGLLARSLPRATPYATPAMAPAWTGLVIDPGDSLMRFGVPHVYAVAVGTAKASARAALVKAVRQSPPFGLVGLDAVTDEIPDGLLLSSFVLPGALIRTTFYGRCYDPSIGADILGFDSDEDREIILTTARLGLTDESGDPLPRLLLRHLTLQAARVFEPANRADGHAALIAHAQELLGLGAVGAAGTVAGVAFERLMNAALSDADREWVTTRLQAGKHTDLSTVIDKVTKHLGLGPHRRRLDDYRRLRNDCAHRLAPSADTDANEVLEAAVAEMIRWLAAQDGADHVTELVDVELPPELDWPDLHAAAVSAAEAAAAAATPTPMRVGTEKILEGAFGASWVRVRARQPFASWLRSAGLAKVPSAGTGAELFSPHDHIERGLAWSWGYARCVRQAGVMADYGGRLT